MDSVSVAGQGSLLITRSRVRFKVVVRERRVNLPDITTTYRHKTCDQALQIIDTVRKFDNVDLLYCGPEKSVLTVSIKESNVAEQITLGSGA